MDNNQLRQYRKMALIRLEQLLIKQDENPTDTDYFVDRSIRLLSQLPELPSGSRPYLGLYGPGKTMDQYRDVATDRILELVEALPQLDKIDEEIDKYIRLLSELPERPEDSEPYTRLFILPTTDVEEIPIKSEINFRVAPAPHTQQFVNAKQLIQIAGTERFKDRLIAFTAGVNETLEKYHINTKLRIAHFLAQVMHESGGFQWLREIWGSTDVQRRYEGRRDLGNTASGDGKRYMGRGLIQLTGRANYQKFTNEVGKALGKDFMVQPELLEQSPYAVLVAGWYWNSRNINAAADKDDLGKVTRLVNGGTNGIEDRRKYLQRAKTVLQNSQFKTAAVPNLISLSSSGTTSMNLQDFYKAKLKYSPNAISDDETLAKSVQSALIWLGFLDPPADGKFGPLSAQALLDFQETMTEKIPTLSEEKGFLGEITAQALIETSPDELPKPELKLSNDLASRIIKYMQQKNYQISTNPEEYNIVYIEGMDTNGKLNNDQPNYFNDVRLVIELNKGKPKISGIWEATTEPGSHYTYHPLNASGAARIAFGQYKAWCVGTHEALVQAADIKVHRDFNKDFGRTGDEIQQGIFAINQHWGYDFPRNDVKTASAGCLVGRIRQSHREFMSLIKQDKRYKQNANYLFLTTIIPGDDLEKTFPPD